MRKPGVWSWMVGWAMAAAVGMLLAGSGTAAQFGNRIVAGDLLEIDGNFTWNGVDIDAPLTGDANNRVWLRGDGTWSGVGLADAGHDVLDATVSTMSNSTWETLLSVMVNVPETTDRVLASVTGQFAWMGASVFVISTPDDTLCEVPDPMAPGAGVTCRELAAEITDPTGIVRRPAGGFYIVDNKPFPTQDRLCEVADPTVPTTVTCRDLAAVIVNAQGLALRPAGGVYVVSNDDLCEIPNPTVPATVTCREVSISAMRGIATRLSGGVFVVTAIENLCSIPDPASPADAVTCSPLAAEIGNPSGLTERPGGGVYVTNNGGSSKLLCEVPDGAMPSIVTCRTFSSVIRSPLGISGVGSAGDCMIRLARGTTAIETLMLESGRILLDTTFVDQGASGSQTYAVEMMTANPFTFCTLNSGNGLGTIPLPSLLVQVFYGS